MSSYAATVPIAFPMCIALVIGLPLLVVASLIKRSSHPRPVSPPSRPVAPQWAPDPTRLHDYRFWNGTRWTAEVSDRGVLSTDPATEY